MSIDGVLRTNLDTVHRVSRGFIARVCYSSLASCDIYGPGAHIKHSLVPLFCVFLATVAY